LHLFKIKIASIFLYFCYNIKRQLIFIRGRRCHLINIFDTRAFAFRF